MTRVLVLGAAGMLGHAVLRTFASSPPFDVIGTVRSEQSRQLFPEALRRRVISAVDVDKTDDLHRVFASTQPHVVVNCIGVVKQLREAYDPLVAIPLNALLPHRLAALSSSVGARFIHVSTDCVFAGTRGMYREEDPCDAHDLYGRSKLLGEVDYPNAVTLRTSIIGHELQGCHSLVSWFLAQTGVVRGFTRAVFSGVPTNELARIMRDHVLPHKELRGLYHVSADPINKFDLLTLIKRLYDKNIDIVPDESVVIDRSLNSSRFRAATGFAPKPWSELIAQMKRSD